MDGFVPGINDLIKGGYETEQGIALSAEEKMNRGRIAIQALSEYRKAAKEKDEAAMKQHRDTLEANFPYFGYGYIKDPADLVPNVSIVFYAFRIMVILGGYFILLFLIATIFSFKNTFTNKKWLHYICLWTIPLGYIAGQAGWVVAEVGRQPWAIQDILPTGTSISRLSTSSVQITFFLFLALFTILLIAEIRIMLKEIKKGPANSH